ncbi:MAG: NAD-dependent epimerase/dehydratase family protein [Holophagales bacterium]|nr:NAD-dependent epimerase/dehydratase family protein [Holophagales bacterium]
MIESLQAAADGLAGFSKDLSTGNGLLPKLVRDETFARDLMKDLSRITESLARVAEKIDGGEGTVGKLVNDPALFEAVDDILVGIDNSKPLKWLVRNRQRSGIQVRYEAEKAKADAASPETLGPAPTPRTEGVDVAFRVLVAGGAGLVGSAVATQLLSEGAEVIVVDAMGDQGDGRAVREKRAQALRSFPKATVVTADLSLPGAASDVFRDLKPDAVVNAALFPPGGPGVVSMLEAMRSHEKPFLVHLSDGALYGSPASPGQPALEEEAIDPGRDPVLLQRMVEESRLRGSDVPHVILRLFRILAPGAPANRFPQDALETLLDGGEVVVDSDAPQDLLHVRDAVHGILAAWPSARPDGRSTSEAAAASRRPTSCGSWPRDRSARRGSGSTRLRFARAGSPVWNARGSSSGSRRRRPSRRRSRRSSPPASAPPRARRAGRVRRHPCHGRPHPAPR